MFWQSGPNAPDIFHCDRVSKGKGPDYEQESERAYFCTLTESFTLDWTLPFR